MHPNIDVEERTPKFHLLPVQKLLYYTLNIQSENMLQFVNKERMRMYVRSIKCACNSIYCLIYQYQQIIKRLMAQMSFNYVYEIGTSKFKKNV